MCNTSTDFSEGQTENNKNAILMFLKVFITYWPETALQELHGFSLDLNIQLCKDFCYERRGGQGMDRGQLLCYWSKANEKGKLMSP